MSRLFLLCPEPFLLGVSNFSVKFLERLLAVAEVVPAVNQVELHPYVPVLYYMSCYRHMVFPSSCTQEELVDFCIKQGIVVTAYSPLGSDNSPLLENDVVKKIAEKYSVKPANVLISLQANKPNVTGALTFIQLPQSSLITRMVQSSRSPSLTSGSLV